jgi:hypothetical protein
MFLSPKVQLWPLHILLEPAAETYATEAKNIALISEALKSAKVTLSRESCDRMGPVDFRLTAGLKVSCIDVCNTNL